MDRSPDSLLLAGRVAIVTGGSRGIGRAVVERLIDLGASVVVNYVRDADSAEDVVRCAREKGTRALAVQADVAKLAEAKNLVEACISHFGRVDILVCNAGI